MHNDEICSVCVGLLYLVVCVRDNKQMHSSSSSWRGRSQGAASWIGRNRGAAAEGDAVGDEVDAIGEQLGLATRDWCSPVALPHKGVGVSEWGAMCLQTHNEGGETSA